MQTSVQQLISPHIMNYTCSIEDIDSSNRRLHNIVGCCVTKAVGL